MMAFKFKDPEIKVFLKCQICDTFLTSPSFPVIKKHFYKCQLKKHQINKSWTRLPEENDDLCDDFVDNKMESVPFSQPFVVINRCKLEHSSKVESDPILRKPLQKPPLIKSLLEALGTPSESNKLESKHKDNLEVNNDKDWESGSEDASNEFNSTTFTFTEKHTKPTRSSYRQKLCCVYNHPNCPFKCDLCTARFTNGNRLTWHKKLVHGNQDAFTCSICGRMFHHRHTLQKHLKSHQDAEDSLPKTWPKLSKNTKSQAMLFKCKYCLMPLTNHVSFVTHMTTDHSDKSEQSSFTCPYTCSTRTNSIKQLIQHFKTAHPEHYHGKAITYIDGKPKKKCDECGKLFDVNYFPSHKAVHAVRKASKKYVGIQCPYPNCQTKSKDIKYLKIHFTLHLQNNPYICIFPGCTMKVDSPARLKRHMKHHVTSPTTCSKCGVSYRRKWKLNNHNCQFNIDKQATGKYKLVLVGNNWRLKPARVPDSSKNCDANKSPVIKDGLPDKYIQHIKSLHRLDLTGIFRSDPVFIEVCKDNPGFGELLLGALNVNCNSDNGNTGLEETSKKARDMQIRCPVCGVWFPGPDTLDTHFSQDHRHGKKLRCKAPNCGRYFVNAQSKQRHFRRYHAHRPYPCPKCDKSYLTQRDFKEHFRTHITDKKLGLANDFGNANKKLRKCGGVANNE